ncbi:Snf7-domain-containing protein [Syncephalis pseudoplumigaleata]|uniref:Snf7-domain-containing protein n=1 Tax=Syncephalis pseudoplumigaleata TaxID=1712513 RepID=A0A4P9YZ73_9FUNG|nr:Snf7-domain-containing protein [Syncephalis pseudoplumigaleata]|eukprot:RKP24892.1 Snf7-domain-containing protein [Syncephalis pseudoplumigaleata]
MHRFFGASKKVPPPTLDGAITSASGRGADSRVESIEAKIRKLEAELARYKEQLGRLREGPSKNAVKQRALRILQQKRQYEQQRDQLQDQIFSMEQTQLATDNLRHTAMSVEAMKQANTALKKQYKGISIDKIEKMQDEMQDLLESANEVQDIMARSYDVPAEVDEADLEAELDALGDELLLEGESTPSYLQPSTALEEAMPELTDTLPSIPSQKNAAEETGRQAGRQACMHACMRVTHTRR